MATRFDLPTPDEFTQPWWDAAAEGRLRRSPAAAAAARPTTTPGPSAPGAGATRCRGRTPAGGPRSTPGRSSTRTTCRPFNEKVPYVAAVVDLDGGARG